MTFQEIPESGIVEVGKKKDKWYNLYKLTEEQESQWLEWANKEIRKLALDEQEAQKAMREVDDRYGFVRKYTKKGELF